MSETTGHHGTANHGHGHGAGNHGNADHPALDRIQRPALIAGAACVVQVMIIFLLI